MIHGARPGAWEAYRRQSGGRGKLSPRRGRQTEKRTALNKAQSEAERKKKKGAMTARVKVRRRKGKGRRSKNSGRKGEVKEKRLGA